MRYILIICLLTSAFILCASEVLKTPEMKTPLLKAKLNILMEPEVIHVQEEKNGKSRIVVKAQGVFKKVNLKLRPGDAGFADAWEKFRPREYVLIEGIDSKETATGNVLFHKQIGVGQRGLFVWYAGVEKVRMKYVRKGKPMWLKKYTADPGKADEILRKKPAK